MSGLMDRQDANSTCTSLKRDHQPCEVVKADQGQGWSSARSRIACTRAPATR